jgi:hypothetical protein
MNKCSIRLSHISLEPLSPVDSRGGTGLLKFKMYLWLEGHMGGSVLRCHMAPGTYGRRSTATYIISIVYITLVTAFQERPKHSTSKQQQSGRRSPLFHVGRLLLWFVASLEEFIAPRTHRESFEHMWIKFTVKGTCMVPCKKLVLALYF